MALYQLGRTEEAGTTLARARTLMLRPQQLFDADARALLNEATELIEPAQVDPPPPAPAGR